MRHIFKTFITECFEFVFGLISLFIILLAIPALLFTLYFIAHFILLGSFPTKEDFTGSGHEVIEPYEGLPWNSQ